MVCEVEINSDKEMDWSARCADATLQIELRVL